MTVWLGRSGREEAPTTAITGRALRSSRSTRSGGAIGWSLTGGPRCRRPLRFRNPHQAAADAPRPDHRALGHAGHPLEPSFGPMVHDLRLQVVAYVAPCPPA